MNANNWNYSGERPIQPQHLRSAQDLIDSYAGALTDSELADWFESEGTGATQGIYRQAAAILRGKARE